MGTFGTNIFQQSRPNQKLADLSVDDGDRHRGIFIDYQEALPSSKGDVIIYIKGYIKIYIYIWGSAHVTQSWTPKIIPIVPTDCSLTKGGGEGCRQVGW